MISLFRRHRKGCEHRSEGRKYRRCKCPIWVDGHLNGAEIRKSLGTSNWQLAVGLALKLETEGEQSTGQNVGPLEAIVGDSSRLDTNSKKTGPPTITEACDNFISDAEARGLREPTLYKFRLLFRGLREFARSNGLGYLSEIDIEGLRQFRATWPNRNFAAKKKWEALCIFFRFAYDSGWIESVVTAKLKPPKTTDRPTMPLTREEVTSILATCDDYPDKFNAVRLRALVLLLRYSGLRIRDAVTLGRDHLTDGKLFLYTAKTGTAVYCPLPPFAVSALEAIPTVGRYFFWSGESKPKSAVGDWQRSLKRLFILAGVPTAHAHRFRDTFSVELLQAGVPIERVSILLGHRSVRVTEKHYNAWTRARQEQAEADVRRTWSETLPETKGTQKVRGENKFVN
jgi:integrase/recombinase XerD